MLSCPHSPLPTEWPQQLSTSVTFDVSCSHMCSTVATEGSGPRTSLCGLHSGIPLRFAGQKNSAQGTPRRPSHRVGDTIERQRTGLPTWPRQPSRANDG